MQPQSAPPDKEPETLYHYTSAQGLMGILGRGEIHVSHISYLNDADEWRYGASLVGEALSELSRSEAHVQRVRDFARVAFTYKNLWSLEAAGFLNRPLFVACFSQSSDSLPQWRGYSSTGARFAIGFSRAKLEQLAGRHVTTLERVEYGREASISSLQRYFAKEMLQRDEGMYLRNTPDRSAEAGHIADYGAVLEGLRTYVAINLKNPAFEEEREWRIALGWRPSQIRHDMPIEYREGKGTLVPFVKLPIRDIAGIVSKVIVGPTAHKELAVQAVSGYVRGQGSWSSGAAIQLSQIPYRDW